MNLLQLLSDGGVHSGVELGAALGVSRAAVWKQLRVLRAKGCRIEALRGQGYRLLQSMDVWDRHRLLASLRGDFGAHFEEIIVLDSVPSTSDIVAERLLRNPLGVIVCVAEEQTQGRGRRGRVWLSPRGGNLYVSLGVKLDGAGYASMSGLSLAVGMTIARVLREQGASDVAVKWPNDLVVGGAKLGGVLIEIQGEAEGPCVVVLGVGLNIALPVAVHEELDREVVDLVACLGREVDRHSLGVQLIGELARLLLDYPGQGFADFLRQWPKYDALAGNEVQVQGLGAELGGIAEGIDESGALLIATKQGLQRVFAGEVSVRRRQE